MKNGICGITLFFLLVLSGGLNFSFAQDSSLWFKRLGPENGLSNRKVNCILQDKRGFLWFGTEDGLNRYDGRYFTVFRSVPGRASGLSGNLITDLYEDKEGMIWIATADGGITRYDYRLPPARQFKPFRYDSRNKTGIPENAISKIAGDRYGNLWLATSGSYVVRFNKRSERFDTPVRKGTKGILTLTLDGDTLLAGRAGGGLLKINTADLTWKTDERYDNLYADMPHASITGIFKDSRGWFWYGSWDDVMYRYSPKLLREEVIRMPGEFPGIEKGEIVSFAEDAGGRIWMAGKNTGVFVYDLHTGRFVNLRHDPLKEGTLADNHTNAVYIDRNRIVWVGTNNGISVYNPLFSSFTQHFLPRGQSDVIIYDFYKDRLRQLWIGTSEGIFIKKPGADDYVYRKVTYKGQKLAVTKFYMDADETFYIGTDYTLFRYDMQSGSVTPLPNTDDDPVMRKLISSRVVSVVRDTLGGRPVLLVSPFGHYITYYDLRAQKWVSRADSVNKILKKYNIKDNLVRKFYPDKDGSLWMATRKAGLGNWRLQKDLPVQYYMSDEDARNSLSSNDVYDILRDESGNLWISTYGGGISYFDRSKGMFRHVSESSNLSEGIQADRSGNLWMLSNGHIHKYDHKAAEYSCYDLPHAQSSGGVRGYIYKDDENNLYAAGANYYIMFNPDRIAGIEHQPAVYFTDFRIYNTSYSHLLEQKTIVLDHTRNFFSISFSAPEFSGDNLRYAYMLEGADKDWIQGGKQNYVQYSNLSGGKYLFKVQATNWEGGRADKFASIVIIITPPFWQRWWFFAGLFCVIALIGYLLYRYRLNVLLKQQAIRNDIAQDLHDQIGSTLSSISVYTDVARIYQEQGENSKLKSVLTTINHTATDMIAEMADIVWAINPKNDHLHTLMARIENYARPLCKVKGIQFSVIHPNTCKGDLTATMQIRKNLYLIIKEALNNAIKHSSCRNLGVEIGLKEQMLYLRIADDGVGFNTDTIDSDSDSSLSGNGLKNIRFRAAELKSRFALRSAPGEGTVIELSFKVR